MSRRRNCACNDVNLISVKLVCVREPCCALIIEGVIVRVFERKFHLCSFLFEPQVSFIIIKSDFFYYCILVVWSWIAFCWVAATLRISYLEVFGRLCEVIQGQEFIGGILVWWPAINAGWFCKRHLFSAINSAYCPHASLMSLNTPLHCRWGGYNCCIPRPRQLAISSFYIMVLSFFFRLWLESTGILYSNTVQNEVLIKIQLLYW